jgi:hypothetical protein
MVVRVSHYNVVNAPIQLLCPKTRRSRHHYDLSIITMIYMSDQLQPDTCLLVRQPCLRRALAAHNFRTDLLSLRLDGSFAVHRGRLFLQNEQIYKLLSLVKVRCVRRSSTGDPFASSAPHSQ